ncbi:MAG TPA: hypothetical protein VM600_03560 [Actinomycetota bacterium]|nr:hypothetical protein [Actinomycetota bacterium]
MMAGQTSDGEQLRAAMRAVSRSLREVHRILIEVVATQLDPSRATLRDRVALFQLVLTDPGFGWLRPMLQLIAQIDELAALADPPDAVEATQIRLRIERMLAPSNDEDEFGSRYVTLLPLEPELAMAHADLRAKLKTLPSA